MRHTQSRVYRYQLQLIMDISVLRAGVEHSALLADLFISLHNTHEMRVKTLFKKINERDETENDIRQKIERKSRIFLICYYDETPCGYLEGSLQKTEESKMFISRLIGRIENIYVLPDYRRLGCATALFSYFFEYAQARKIDFFELDVLSDNLGAISFYNSLGFFSHRITMLRNNDDVIH